MLDWFAKRYSPKERALFRFLRKSNIFEKLTDDELAEFLPYLHLRKYQQNEVIFFRNDPSQALYMIKSGFVVLNLDIQDKFEELLTLTKGEIFGDNAIIEGTTRNYNAICASDTCEVYVIPQVNLMSIFDDKIEIRAKMMTAFAQYYDRYVKNIYRIYRDTFGFFELGHAYLMAKRKENS